MHNPEHYRCAIYYRVSTDRQKKEQTIDSQKRLLPPVAKLRGWEIVGEYTDDGYSGETVDGRPAFQKLISDAEKRLFDIVLVIDLDRITRSKKSAEGAVIYDHFRECGIKLATPSDIIDLENEDHDFLAGVKREVAKWEKRKILARTKRGRDEARLQGKFLGGDLPEPYYFDKLKNICIDPIAKERVVKVITLSKNLSTYQVSKATGYPQRQIHRLTAEKRLLFYSALRKDPQGNLIKCKWEPIILWDDARDILTNKKTRYNPLRVAKYLLTGNGKFRCGYCGRSVKSYTTKKISMKGVVKHYRYYRCHSSTGKSDCPISKMTRAGDIEEKVTRIIGYAIKNINITDYKKEEQPEVDAQIQKLRGEKENLARSIQILGLDENLKRNFEKVKTEIERLELKRFQASKGISREDLGFISTIDINTLNFQKLKELLQICTKGITLYNNYALLEFSFNYGNPPRNTSRIHLTRTSTDSDK